jgi:hypothetical protein
LQESFPNLSKNFILINSYVVLVCEVLFQKSLVSPKLAFLKHCNRPAGEGETLTFAVLRCLVWVKYFFVIAGRRSRRGNPLKNGGMRITDFTIAENVFLHSAFCKQPSVGISMFAKNTV